MALMRVYCGLAASDPAGSPAGTNGWLTVAVVDDAGRLLDVCDIGDDPVGYAELGALLAERSGGAGGVAVAADSDEHQVDLLLAAAGRPLAIVDDETVADYADRFADDESPEEMEAGPAERSAVGLARALQAGALAAASQGAPRELIALKPVLAAHAAGRDRPARHRGRAARGAARALPGRAARLPRSGRADPAGDPRRAARAGPARRHRRQPRSGRRRRRRARRSPASPTPTRSATRSPRCGSRSPRRLAAPASARAPRPRSPRRSARPSPPCAPATPRSARSSVCWPRRRRRSRPRRSRPDRPGDRTAGRIDPLPGPPRPHRPGARRRVGSPPTLEPLGRTAARMAGQRSGRRPARRSARPGTRRPPRAAAVSAPPAMPRIGAHRRRPASRRSSRHQSVTGAQVQVPMQVPMQPAPMPRLPRQPMPPQQPDVGTAGAACPSTGTGAAATAAADAAQAAPVQRRSPLGRAASPAARADAGRALRRAAPAATAAQLPVHRSRRPCQPRCRRRPADAASRWNDSSYARPGRLRQPSAYDAEPLATTRPCDRTGPPPTARRSRRQRSADAAERLRAQPGYPLAPEIAAPGIAGDVATQPTRPTTMRPSTPAWPRRTRRRRSPRPSPVDALRSHGSATAECRRRGRSDDMSLPPEPPALRLVEPEPAPTAPALRLVGSENGRSGSRAALRLESRSEPIRAESRSDLAPEPLARRGAAGRPPVRRDGPSARRRRTKSPTATC